MKKSFSARRAWQSLAKAVSQEIREVLSRVDPGEADTLIREILKAEKVFVFAVGRVFLSLQCFAKRLAHLGIDIQVVGSVTEEPITPKDLLLIASGSGESKLPAEIAKIAKNHKARVGLITSSRTSTIKSIADFCIHLPCPTKANKNEGVKSIQSMSTLFDQSLHIFGDILCILIQKKKGVTNEELWRRHANLE